MTFTDAIYHIEKGFKLKRKNWPNTNYLFSKTRTFLEENYVKRNTDGSRTEDQRLYILRIDEYRATDWEVVSEDLQNL